MTSDKCKNSLELVRRILVDADLWFPMCHGTSTEFIKPIMEKGLEPRQCTEDGFCRPSNWTGDLISQTDRIYLGHGQTAHCGRAASRAEQETGGLGVVLKVKNVPDKKELVVDEDYAYRWDRLFEVGGAGIIGKWMLDSDYRGRKELCQKNPDPDKCIKVAFEFIYSPDKINRKIFENQLVEIMENCESEEVRSFFWDLPQWTKSLTMMKTVGYRGTIPPELLVIEKEWQSMTAPALVMEEVRRKIE